MNIRLKIAIVFSLTLQVVNQGFAQNEEARPKIGIVLSGGGAKGFAHIGFLKVLEEAGIKPDYITGTSAGSLVGALYSMGYSPSELEELAKNVNWDEAMGNEVSLNRVAIEEKDYYSRYIIDLNIDKDKFDLPGGLVTGHQLEQLIAKLTQPYHHVNEFQKFPIPFKCVATNLETGEPVVLDSGNIVKSIRASMSIPTIFTPIEIDGKLLVDGGLVRNFPVQEVIDMGADIVIGVYTGAQLKDKEALGNLVSVLSQSAFLMGIYDAKEQFNKCRVLIEPDLGDLGGNDFDAIDSIINRGERSARKHLNELQGLSDSLRNAKMLKTEIDSGSIQAKERFYIDSIEVIGIDRVPREFVLGKLQIEQASWVDQDYIQERIEVLYGTQYFKKIGYRIIEYDTNALLTLDVVEVAPAKLRFALHYDTDTRTGLTLNFTSRNALVPSSRLIAELDIAELPKAEINYFQYTGKEQDIALVLRARASQESEFVANNFIGEDAIYRMRSVLLSGGIQTTSAVNWKIGGFINKEYNSVRPVLNGDTIMESLNDHSAFLSGVFSMNTTTAQFFPMKGLKLEVEGRFYFDMEQALQATAQSKSLEGTLNETELQQGNYNNLRVSFDWIKPISKRFSLTTNAFISAHSTNNIQVTDAFFIGGIAPKNFGSVPFWGTDVNTLFSSNIAVGKIGFRWQPLKRFYIDGIFNYMDVEMPFRWIDEGLNTFRSGGVSRFEGNEVEYRGDFFSSTYGGGVRFSLMTFFGPVSFALSGWERSRTLQPFFSIGFTL